MLESDVIGNKEWTRGVLCDIDISYLEALDSEMRSRRLSNTSGEASTNEQPLDENAGKLFTHCEHGLPLDEKCGKCPDFTG
jgi:hypothetical protein